MTLIEKLGLFVDLTSEEKIKAKTKFLPTLALVSTEEIKDILSYLDSQGVKITKAREIKVIGNPLDEIIKKFNILSEIHETEIYRQDPNMINRNVIDIYKKIKYCIQIGKNYKREDGTYESFIFNEGSWQKEFNKESDKVTESISTPLDEEIVTVEPVTDSSFVFSEESEIGFDNVIDINDYVSMNKDVSDLDAKTTNFETVRKELESQLAELDALKGFDLGDDEISFENLEPETYGRGLSA